MASTMISPFHAVDCCGTNITNFKYNPIAPSHKVSLAPPPARGFIKTHHRESASQSAFLLVFGLSVVQYLVMHLYFEIKLRQEKRGKAPPSLPFAIPVLGNAINYLTDPVRFMNSTACRIARHNPIRVKLFTQNIVLIFGPQNVAAIWKHSSRSTSMPLHAWVLGNVFGLSKKAAKMHENDNSGSRAQPKPLSKIEARNRVDFHSHQATTKLLTGAGLYRLYNRFAFSLTKQISKAESRVSDDWTYIPDFFGFVQGYLTPALMEALCGPQLLSLAPTFCEDLWDFVEHASPLFLGTPRLLCRGSHQRRDRVLHHLRQWHAYARQHFDPSALSEDADFDPCWGSSFFRKRQEVFLQMDNFDYAAVASEDLGLIFGSVANSVPTALWACFEAFRDRDLLRRCRDEAALAMSDSSGLPRDGGQHPFEISKLLEQPVMQSVYTETLRLRASAFVPRYILDEPVEVQSWKLPARQLILIPASAAHMDEESWNTGAKGEHPLDKFWGERFLVSAGGKGPLTGPARQVVGRSTEKIPEVENGQAHSAHKFSAAGVSRAFLPYGGGPRICPGRHFAKRQIMLTLAMLVSRFDVEFVGDAEAKPNMKDFGLGVLKPANKMPCKIRRR